MKKCDWHPIKENVFPKIGEVVEVTYRAVCPTGNFWNLMPAHYIGVGVFILQPGGKKVRRAVSAWRYVKPQKLYIPDDWDYDKDLDNWWEFS